ncbi:unnamed protein product [Fusarium equiseti]|uniref:Uncharacterized protein n=1 Tax=Fusarium equiseti TaxID=61235 RepID=A0A8J2NMS0_FUSEQ|nr:unnamed protein product [Fusarium equiseti]
MEPAQQNNIAVPPVISDRREIHRLARGIKKYLEAAQKNALPSLNDYFANSALIMREHLQLAAQVIDSGPERHFGPALCDGTRWPLSWPRDRDALVKDLQNFTVAAVALLNSRQPAGSVDPNLVAQPANGL